MVDSKFGLKIRAIANIQAFGNEYDLKNKPSIVLKIQRKWYTKRQQQKVEIAVKLHGLF